MGNVYLSSHLIYLKIVDHNVIHGSADMLWLKTVFQSVWFSSSKKHCKLIPVNDLVVFFSC